MSYLIYQTETGQYHIAHETGALDDLTINHPSLEAAMASLNGHNYAVYELEKEFKPAENPRRSNYGGGAVKRTK